MENWDVKGMKVYSWDKKKVNLPLGRLSVGSFEFARSANAKDKEVPNDGAHK
jgi:hypothetical protein